MSTNLPWLDGAAYRPVWGPLVLIALAVAGVAWCVEPAYTAIRSYQHERALTQSLTQQMILQPLYAQLRVREMDSRWKDLPALAKKPLTTQETRDAGAGITRLLEAQGVVVKKLQPTVHSGPNGTRFLHVEVQSEGSFESLAEGCRSLLAHAGFAGLDRVTIRAASGQQIHAEWSLWLEVE